MRRSALPNLAALMAATTLTLTSCGAETKANDTIQGADKGGSSPSPTTAETIQPQVDFDLPKDVKVEIANDATGDKAKDAILTAHADILMARQKLFTDRKASDKWLTTFFTGEAKKFYASEVKRSHEEGWTITGTYRYYERKVQKHSGDLAFVQYCVDQTKAYGKDVDTGKVDKTEPSSSDYRLHEATLYKEPGGVGNWKLQSFNVTKGAAGCR